MSLVLYCSAHTHNDRYPRMIAHTPSSQRICTHCDAQSVDGKRSIRTTRTGDFSLIRNTSSGLGHGTPHEGSNQGVATSRRTYYSQGTSTSQFIETVIALSAGPMRDGVVARHSRGLEGGAGSGRAAGLGSGNLFPLCPRMGLRGSARDPNTRVARPADPQTTAAAQPPAHQFPEPNSQKETFRSKLSVKIYWHPNP